MGRLNAHPMLRWRFTSAMADRLLIAPQDLRTADPTRASEIYAGRFAFAGKIVICDGRSPFEIEPPSDEWADQLLGFGWLRHLRAADSSITRANARALVGEWIALQGAFDTIDAWRPDLVARRIISWLCQAPLVLHDADMKFYRRFLRNLTRQVRYLHRTMNATRDGVPRLQAIDGADLCGAVHAGAGGACSSRVTRRLSDELGRQVLPDGGHASRNPGALVELLLDLLPLRQAFAARNVPPPAALNNAIDRMMPMLRFFRHGDGNFALFNGMGPTRSELVSTVLAYDDARGAPVANAPHSGYQRVQAGEALLMVEAGSAAANADERRGACRVPFVRAVVTQSPHRGQLRPAGDEPRHLAPCRARDRGAFDRHLQRHVVVPLPRLRVAASALLGVPILAGPADVQVSRQEREGGVILQLSHDGYADRFGVLHHRSLRLHADGRRLDGEDVFMGAHGESLPARRGDAFAVRFHLHPGVKASRHSDGHGAMLVLPNREVWTFDAYEQRVELEESVYLAGPDGPRRAVQIVIHGHARQVPRVHWTFAHQDAQEPVRRALREEPELPL